MFNQGCICWLRSRCTDGDTYPTSARFAAIHPFLLGHGIMCQLFAVILQLQLPVGPLANDEPIDRSADSNNFNAT